MKPTRNGAQDNRKRRPIPWPRHVEIAAVFAVAFAFLAFFYVFFGSASEDVRRFALFLGYEDGHVRRCESGLAYYLKFRKKLRLVQQEVYQDVDPHDVRLAYHAQDPSGAVVRGEFRCVFRWDSTYTADLGPRFSYIEVDGIRLPSRQTQRIDYLRPMEMQQNR